MLTLLDIDKIMHTKLQERATITSDFILFLQKNHSAVII